MSLLRKSKSHNAPQGSVLLGTALLSHGERGCAPTNCCRTVRHSMSTNNRRLEPVRQGSTCGSGGILPVLSLASICADVWILPNMYLPRKVSYFLYIELQGSGSRCHIFWVLIWASAYPHEMFQCKLNLILEGLHIQKTSAGDTLHR